MTEQRVEAFRAAGVVVMTIVVIFLLLGFGVVKLFTGATLDDAVKLPLLVISGLISLIALLAVMAIAFKTVHLANQTQALGLPDGTVRAVIALSLILIFAVVTVYLFSDLSNGDATCCQDIAGIKNQIEKLGAAKTSTATDTATTSQTTTNPTTVGNGNTTTSTASSPADTRRQSQLSASQDFAKQLLIMLGTLITSITSFYFASKTGEASSSAKSQPTGPTTAPNLKSVDPSEMSSANPPPEITLTGDGLQGVNAVSLKNKTGTIINIGPPDALSSDTLVRFKTPSALTAGTWSISVKSRDGGEAGLADGITVT